MKICLIVPFFDPWSIGGVEKYAKTLAEELSVKHQVVIITTTGPVPRKPSRHNDNPKIIEIKPMNISTPYDMVHNDSSVGSIKKYLWHFFDLWNLSSYIEVKNILKSEKPDLVHTNGTKGFSQSLFSVIKHLGIPHVHTTHELELISRWTTLFRNGKPVSQFNIIDRIYMFYMRIMSSNIDAVISPSKFTMNFHEKLGYFKNSNKYIIPNGTKLDKDIKAKDGSEKEFLFLGQITELKGAQIAVNAFKRITDKSMKLHICGDGPYLESLKKIAEGDERIIFHGFVQGDNKNKIFSKCSYVIFPSVGYENFPLVIIESMNKGLPIIASNIGGIPELVKDGYNGFLFEAGNVDSLHKIIETSINDKDLISRLSKNAIESSRKFSIENQIESTMDVYSRVVSGKLIK